MNICSYNIRGMNKRPKQVYVRNLLASNNVSLVGLLETRVKQVNFGSVTRFINSSWEWLNNYSSHVNGRIWLGIIL